MLATGVLACTRPYVLCHPLHLQQIGSIPTRSNLRPAPPISSALGLAINPYDPAPLPTRVLVAGAAAKFPSVANLICDVFNGATEIVPTQAAPHHNEHAADWPSRAVLGAAYVPRWV
ncbi:hypothetical protein DFH09DRAFT_1325695 [Mycena vulgaris]|nr:hypothetical protein DFH09DRAFT_1325695 [Mycena vulgaris]